MQNPPNSSSMTSIPQKNTKYRKYIFLILIFVIISLTAVLVFLIKSIQEKDNVLKRDPRNEAIVNSFTPESKAAFHESTATFVEDYLYIGTSTDLEADELDILPDNFFYKMDLDFNIIWQYPLDKSMTAGAASLDDEGNIYFVTNTLEELTEEAKKLDDAKDFTDTMQLISLTNSGELRWKRTITMENELWRGGMVSPMISTDQKIFVAGSKFYAFDSEGNIEWEFPEQGRINGLKNSPIIDSLDDVYLVSPEPQLETSDLNGKLNTNTDQIRIYKFKKGQGPKTIWSTLLDNNKLNIPENGGLSGKAQQVASTPGLGADEKVVYAAVGNTMNKVDAVTGELLWSYKPKNITGSFIASPVIDGEDNVYVGTKSNENSTIYAFKADGSGLLWEKLIGADLYTSAIIGDDNRIYFGSELTPNGQYHSVNISTGEFVWHTGYEKTPVTSIGQSSSVLYKGYVYIGSYRIYTNEIGPQALHKIKINAHDYDPSAAWPCIYGRINK